MARIFLKPSLKIGTEYFARKDMHCGLGEPSRYGGLSIPRQNFCARYPFRKPRGDLLKWVLLTILLSFPFLPGCEDDGDAQDSGTGGVIGTRIDTGGTSGIGGQVTTGGTSGIGGQTIDSGLDGAVSTVDASATNNVDTGTASPVDASGDSAVVTGPEDPVDRSHLSDVGTTQPLNYSDPALWVCHPDITGDFCETDIDATEVMADGSYQLVEHVPAVNPEFDCFYVYPTVLLTGDPQQTDFSDIGIVSDPILSQAAPFTRLCRMYAPLYRQFGLNPGTGTLAEGGDSALALQDVTDAFNYYMQNHNQGRPFVLIGHSQGTMMLTSMIQQELDNDPARRAQMISALLLGGRVTVPEGQLVGGTYQNIPLCSSPGQTGCVVAYVSYAAEAPPGDNAVFSSTTEVGNEIACTNPALLAGNTGPFQGSYLRTAVRNPSFAPDIPLPDDITTPFALYRNVIQGQCVKNNGHSYLEISLTPNLEAGRPTPGYRSSLIEGIGMGLHLVDFNLPLEDLIEMVRQQAAAMP